MTKWKLVPVEPTPEMIDVWNNDDSDEFRHAYRAMLEAAPQPPKSEPIAYIEHHKGGDNLVWDNPGGKYSVLYTAPPAPKLSDERILEIYASESGRPITMGKARIIAQARAIEREILGGEHE